MALVGIVLAVMAPCALAQTETSLREGELSCDIDVRFISTYRDGSWVPVDIIVNNNQRDINGFLELTTLMAGVEQAPKYRVPVDSPKGSRKRFRLYCQFDGTTDVEVMLYRGSRPALRVPLKIALRPIARNDYLCLVLDNDPTAYSYLYNAVLDGATDQALYRIELTGEELGALPDRLRCYETIDLIVIGGIDPNDISRRHRALIRRYVEDGGTLAISGGAHTPLHRGTWVEELAGVSMGSVRIINERECADIALRARTSDRINDAKQGELTELTPTAEGVYRWGGEATLASLRPLGLGVVAVIGLDMDAKLLHTTSEYAALWSHLVQLRMTRPDINYTATDAFLSNQLPNVAGVRVFPRSSVATYLTIYLLVAIVGNWLFWSFLKRREMAWVCLVFFSAGFTAYAMIYGTAGRAKETELEQINIVRIQQHTPVAKVHSTIGLLSARSARYSFELADEGGLVSKSESPYYMGSPQGRFAEGAFAFTQGTRPRVDDLRVGASVMRTLKVESELTLSGGIEGSLTHDEDGIHGTLVNHTGLFLQSPWIYYQGRTFRAKAKPTGVIEVNRASNRLSDTPRGSSHPGYLYGGYYHETQSVDAAIREPLASLIFTSASNNSSRDTSQGPYLYGWAADSPPSPIVLEEDANEKIRETFVVADIEIAGDEAALTRMSLPVSIDGRPTTSWGTPNYWGWHNQSTNLYWNSRMSGASPELPVTIDLPRDIVDQAAGALIVELNYTIASGALPMRFTAANVDDDWHKERAVTKAPISIEVFGTQVNALRYRIDDWQAIYDREEQAIDGIAGFVVSNPNDDGGRQGARRRTPDLNAQFTVQAYMETSPRRIITEEWQAWQ